MLFEVASSSVMAGILPAVAIISMEGAEMIQNTSLKSQQTQGLSQRMEHKFVFIVEVPIKSLRSMFSNYLKDSDHSSFAISLTDSRTD